MDKMFITFSESDVVVLPLELLCRSLVHTVNIGEWPLLRLSDVTFLGPTHFSIEVRSTEDRPNFAWGFCFRSIILQPSPPIVDVILEVLAVNKLLDLILEGDTFLSRVTDVLVVPTVFVLVLLGAVSTQWVKLFEYPSLLRGYENILP